MFQRDADPRLHGLDQASVVFSMLSAHEFALEVLLAFVFAGITEEQAASLGEDFVRRWDRVYSATLTTDPNQIADTTRQVEASQAFAERLVEKAQRRADELRQQRRPAAAPSNDVA